MNSGLSIVLPAYNAESWLEQTIERMYISLGGVPSLVFEVIIIDDGSTDQTLVAAQKIATKHPEVRVLTQTNQGRYLTRKRGVEEAKQSRVFFIDARVWVDEGSIAFLCDQLRKHSDRKVWNGHINVAKKGNMIARFGDALTIIGWRRYFRNPRLVSYGTEDFDYYPKGTGLFSSPRQLLLEAMEWFEQTTTDIRNSSDDTLLIRRIAESERIWLSPEFSATYHARTTLRAFVKHSYFRGQFFVDGFLRKGTRFYYPLLGFLFISPLAVVFSVFYPAIFIVLALLWLAGGMAGLLFKLQFKDCAALFMLAPIFSIAYGAGIWRAVIRRLW